MNNKEIEKIFLSQSYNDCYEIYNGIINNEIDTFWDYVIITASNEEQADSYRAQVNYRINNDMLPIKTKYLVIADPEGKRIGSGGSTINVLNEISNIEKDINNLKILLIHSGGDSRRVPQYSAVR